MVQATPAPMTARATSSWRRAPRESTWETICQRSTAEVGRSHDGHGAEEERADHTDGDAPSTCVRPLYIGHRLRIGSIGRRGSSARPAGHPKAARHYHGQDAPPTRATMRLRAPRAVTLPPLASSGRGRSTARRGWSIWAYRSLIWNFTQRDLKARYKGTAARMGLVARGPAGDPAHLHARLLGHLPRGAARLRQRRAGHLPGLALRRAHRLDVPGPIGPTGHPHAAGQRPAAPEDLLPLPRSRPGHDGRHPRPDAHRAGHLRRRPAPAGQRRHLVAALPCLAGHLPGVRGRRSPSAWPSSTCTSGTSSTSPAWPCSSCSS